MSRSTSLLLIIALSLTAAGLSLAQLPQSKPVPDPAFRNSVTDCPPPGITLDGTVLRVIDGDTIVVVSAIEYQVRLIDCWSPESRTTDKAQKSRGLKSKARMVELTTGKPVRIHLPGHSDLTDMTTLGRVLGRAWILHSGIPAREDLSSIMVREKLANPQKQSKELTP